MIIVPLNYIVNYISKYMTTYLNLLNAKLFSFFAIWYNYVSLVLLYNIHAFKLDTVYDDLL